MRKTINWSRLFSVLFVFAIGLTIVINQNSAKEFTKQILESNWPTVIWWLIIASAVTIQLFSQNSNHPQKTGLIYESFGKYADSLFSAGTYGFAGSTSIALLKGIYLQIFFQNEFFSGFGNFDLVSIFIVSSFLLFYSATEILKLIFRIIYQFDAIEVSASV